MNCHKCDTPLHSRMTYFTEGGKSFPFCDRCFEQLETYEAPNKMMQFMLDPRQYEASLIERAKERRERGESKWGKFPKCLNHEWGSEDYASDGKPYYKCNKCGDKLQCNHQWMHVPLSDAVDCKLCGEVKKLD